VVDGQQRLTPIRILLEYFEKHYLVCRSYKERYNKEVFHIDYETRPGTEKFLQNISGSDGDYIDYHFIKEAYSTVAAWFTQKRNEGEAPDDLCDTILRTLIYDRKHKKAEGIVQVIWYDIKDDKNPIETFTRINMGKIPLSSSELIKALFLRERNFSGNNELMELWQLQIASEWDRIETTLQNDDFWWFLNRKKNDASARIEFIFDLMCGIALQHDPSLKENIGSDQYASFRYFYTKLSGEQGEYKRVRDAWDEVKEYFHCFEDWFNNYTWYHYIGFLICCGKSIADIYRAYKEGIHEEETEISADTKEDINKVLEHLISRHFRSLEWESAEDQEPYINLYSSGKDKPMIQRLLLLYNIEYIVWQCNNKHLVYKFPFKSFKESTWDVEHIDSYTVNGLSDKPSQKNWLKSSERALSMLEREREALKMPDSNGKLGNLRNRIKKYLEEETMDKSDAVFLELYEQIRKVFGEDENGEELKNNIGNLTLLDSGTNRGYGNALFRIKRETIIKKDREGIFIPIGTKNVFLKYFDDEGLSSASWSRTDIEKYRKNIADTLEKFLPPRQVKGV
jgi:DNA-directed RNA polymerase subunit N (RpoN/RPB10)